MTRLQRLLRSPVTTGVLFVLAAGLLLTSTIGGARAALTIVSDDYTAQVEMKDIGVSLYENDTPVGRRDYVPYSDYRWDTAAGAADGMLLMDILGDDTYFKPGKEYDAAYRVQNSGNIPEYVRVSIYKYWTDADGSKRMDLDPSLIHLSLVNTGDWLMDASASTEERTVLYYRYILPTGAFTSFFTDTLSVDAELAAVSHQTVTREGDYTVITTTYDYDDSYFQIEVEVDAVQTHNAREAILSAWGREAAISNGVIQSVRGAA